MASASIAQTEGPEHALARKAATLVTGWGGVPTNVEPQKSSSRCVFKVTSRQRPCEALCVRLLRPQCDSDLLRKMQVLAAVDLELQQICAVSAAQPPCGSTAADRFVWTHGSLSFENLLEQRWPADLAPLYEGTLSHPQLGQNIEIRVQLDSGTQGCWQALGQTEAVVVNASEGHVVFRDTAGKTQLNGAVSAGFVRGEVVQNGSRGGSFVLIGLTEGTPEPQLKAVDVELAGRRPAKTDISYLFLTWGLADDLCYPSLSTRRAFASAYLAASCLPAGAASIDELLWAVECESLLQAAWLGLAGTLASASSRPPPLAPLAMQLAAGLPAARAALAKAVGDVALRQAILEHGVFGLR